MNHEPKKEARVFRIPGQERSQGQKWVLPPVANEGRKEREDRQWRDTFDKFTALWKTRSNDLIERGHPFEFWAWKQRAKHRDGTLQAWRRELLESISFPLVAARIEQQTDNLTYARRLHSFFLRNGHFAPTITYAGGGLTHWVRRMRNSGGKQGIVSDKPETAALANAYLIEHIPGFDWAKTVKRDINFLHDRTHNGFIPSMRLKSNSRAKEVIQRARASMEFRPDHDLPDSDKWSGTPFNDFLSKCHHYDQAVRVHVTGFQSSEDWWLESLNGDEVDGTSLVLELAHPVWVQGERVSTQRCQVEVRANWRQWVGFSEDGALFMAIFEDPASAHTIVLDMDVALADQTHRGGHPLAWRGDSKAVKSASVEWVIWTDPRTFPTKCASASTTANVAFLQNLKELTEFIEQAGATEDEPVHVSWGHTRLFKFLEHMHRKANNGLSQPSHMERLCDLPFTWGEHKRTAMQLFAREAGLDGCAFSLKVAPLQSCTGPDMESPRRFESVRHACLYIAAFARKVADRGMCVICNGEDDQWAYFYSVRQIGDRLSIEYTYSNFFGKTASPDEIYGTDLELEDVLELIVQPGGVSGSDADGDRFEMFISTPLCVEARGIMHGEYEY